jgi:uncharacterized protein (DUF2132 family)
MKPTDTAATDLPAADTEITDKPIKQRNNPLHGVTLETVVTELVAYYGWGRLAEQIPLKCFSSDPSISSSLKFLRKTPWAREKVESLYGFMLREIRRGK